MAFIKPQNPLKDVQTGNYIYPLTTVDQVVLENGERLNTILGEGGSIVPSSTTEDNGKFLRVVNGVAAWVALPNAEEASF